MKINNKLNKPERVDLPKNLRMCRELNAAAIQAKQDRGLTLWYLLRALDPDHSGRISYSVIVPSLKGLGYSTRTLSRTLSNSLYFEVYRNGRTGERKIRIKSLRSVIEALHVALPPTVRWVEVPGNEIPAPTQVGKWRALLYNVAAYKPLGTKTRHPQSRRTIEENTGVNDRQQRRYDRRIGTDKLLMNFKWRENNGHKLSPAKIIVESSGQVVALKENLFYSKGSRGTPGQLRVIARNQKRQQSSSGRTEEARNKLAYRRYYSTGKAARNALIAQGTGDTAYPLRSNFLTYVLECTS